MKEELLAVILGGGKGTRLFPLTKYRAKPAIPFGGKFRIIDISISNCINSGIDQIFILTQFNTRSLHRHIYCTYRLGRFSEGFVDILAAQQTTDNMNWYQGTADAVRQNLRYITEVAAQYTIILSGDHLYRMDYYDFLDTHVKQRADLTIAVKPVSCAEAPKFGILQADANNRIYKFVEKPAIDTLDSLKSPGLPAETPLLASMGIYIFSINILVDVLNKSDGDDFGKHIISTAIDNYRVIAHQFKDYWRDIGTINSFFLANLELTALNPPFSFYDDKFPIFTRSYFLPGTRLDNCHTEQALIAEGCFIEKCQIKNAVIGIRTKIARDSRIENAVIMGADYYESANSKNLPAVGIGRECLIRNAIVDKNARIGNGVVITNQQGKEFYDGADYYIREGIVVIPKNTTIPDGTVI